MPLVYADEDMAAAVMGAASWHAPYAEVMGMGEQEEYMADYLQVGAVRRRVRRGWQRRGYGKKGRGKGKAPALRRAPPGWRWAYTRTGLRLVRVAPRPPGLLPKLRLPGGVGSWGYTPPSPQMGANILESIGLKSPLTRYREMGWSDARIYTEFTGVYARSAATAAQIPNARVRADLAKLAAPVVQIRASLAPVYGVAVVSAGARDRALLEEYVLAAKKYQSAVTAAAGQYGIRPVTTTPRGALPTAPGATVPAGGGGGFNPLLLAIPLALALT